MYLRWCVGSLNKTKDDMKHASPGIPWSPSLGIIKWSNHISWVFFFFLLFAARGQDSWLVSAVVPSFFTSPHEPCTAAITVCLKVFTLAHALFQRAAFMLLAYIFQRKRQLKDINNKARNILFSEQTTFALIVCSFISWDNQLTSWGDLAVVVFVSNAKLMSCFYCSAILLFQGKFSR